MDTFSLYKLGRYGWFHVTTESFNTIEECIKEWQHFSDVLIKENYKIGDYKIVKI